MLDRVFSWLRRRAAPPVFVIRIVDGTASLHSGRAPRGFVDDCAAIAAEFGCREGEIEGVRSERGVVLRFSAGIGAQAHQRFRNVFGLPGAGLD